MTILITADNEFTTVGSKTPEVGKKYNLEKADNGTAALRRTFHALVQEWYKSGCWSYDCDGFDNFRKFIKRDYGAGFDSYIYIADIGTDKQRLEVVKELDDVPENLRNSEYCRAHLKSCSQYTKKEYSSAIDMIIPDMISQGVQTPHFKEILDGLGT